MDQRIEFAMRAVNCPNFMELCQEYGISRKTGYKWLNRYEAEGLAGMREQSRRPHGHGRELGEAVVCRIIKLKNAHLHWGPRKIRALYARKNPGEQLPSESSFKRVLERAGLTKARRRRAAKQTGRIASGRTAKAANEIWSVDFKGWWHARNGQRVEPLTVRDEYSRMVLELRALENIRTETVRGCFERLFERYGLPGAIRSDNGTPFASSHGLFGLSRLSAWWLVLGIDLERGRPGCPQDNGAHERMHRDVRDDLEAGRIGRDQAAFDLWRQQFNTERPHEALAMACPADHYESSPRKYEGTPDEIDYGAMDTRALHPRHGTICYQKQIIAISAALRGWSVGLAPQGNDLSEVWFANLLLGHLDGQTLSFRPLATHARGAATGASGDSATLRRPKRRGNPTTKS